ncbi:FtsX-like permease family protein [Metabacillus litoralis]|jgi:putative ABC transport system permease protein|uniref:FtsX-like permease family protein n=1 Tax=Metabacillus litoralis TaxID=152268 RepID=UPI00203EA1E3|nr:ABC transporter permease [Metabacillus litoralis]MCM3651422.1 ABC transporter permease [Metabacillus litoralis]
MTFRQFAYRNVIRNKRTYAAYFLSSAFSVMIFFVYALFIFHPGIQHGVTNTAARQLMIAAEFIMYFFSFFFVIYSVSTFLKSRKREFGILMMHGMTKSQLNWLVFLENMLIGVGAIILGIGTGLITGKLFLMIGSVMLKIETLSFHLSYRALSLTIIAFLALFLIISFFTTFLVRTNKLIDLFQSGQKPKKEPKVSIVLSLGAAFLLLSSYFLAATTTMETLLFRMLPVIGMTVIGTYFFYTQLSVFIIKLLQKNRRLFRKKTNMITISNLAYRLKDNARMFFMVTIVSTVAFCAVGTLASMNVINKQFEVDYPAAISYVAKDNQPIHKQNLQQIETELKAKRINYTTYQLPILYVDVIAANEKYAPAILPLISFSDYKEISKLAGFDFSEKPPKDDEAIGMTTHRFENDHNLVNYTLGQNRMEVQSNGYYTKHVTIPRELVEEDGLVVNDDFFAKLIDHEKKEMFTGFFIEDYKKTNDMLENLVNEGRVKYSDNNSYAMAVSGTLLHNQMNLFSMMLFIALLIGAVFFIAAGSFLYFRLYADIDYDVRQYLTVMRVGLTDTELTKIITHQMLILFFVPIIVAIIHSIFAFIALQSYFTLSIATETIAVLVCFFFAQMVYFFFIRKMYIRKLKKSLI